MNHSRIDLPDGVGKSTSRDERILKARAQLISNSGQSIEDILTHVPAFARRVAITRFLAHYEIYKEIQALPGSIVELGVFKGSSLMSFSHFLEIFHPGDRSRKVIGFDSFGGLSDFSLNDGNADSSHGKCDGGWSASNFEPVLSDLIELFHEESFVPQAKRIHIVKGDINDTVPAYVADNPGLRISLLHFDCDLYQPTLVGLKNLAPLVVAGGLIVFDEYAITAWAGETTAVEEYFGRGARIQKFSWSTLPGGFIKMPHN